MMEDQSFPEQINPMLQMSRADAFPIWSISRQNNFIKKYQSIPVEQLECLYVFIQ